MQYDINSICIFEGWYCTVVVSCDIEPLIRSLLTLWKGWENVINFCHSEYILATSAQWLILTLFRSLRDQLQWLEWNKVYSCHPLFWSKYHNSGHSNVWLKQKKCFQFITYNFQVQKKARTCVEKSPELSCKVFTTLF